MNSIVGIIDVDGFTIQKKWHCKELGTLRVCEYVTTSYFFNIGVRWSDLCEKIKRSCKFVARNIHKLPLYVTRVVTPCPLVELDDIVVKL